MGRVGDRGVLVGGWGVVVCESWGGGGWGGGLGWGVGGGKRCGLMRCGGGGLDAGGEWAVTGWWVSGRGMGCHSAVGGGGGGGENGVG